MRYTKTALLIFGCGLMFGFVVVVGEFARLERWAAALMALGLVMIPAGLFADGHGIALLRWLAARFRRRRPTRPRARKPAHKTPARRTTRPRPTAKPARRRS